MTMKITKVPMAAVASVHGGAVSAEAPPAGGLVVTVLLPAASAAAIPGGPASQ